MKDISLMSRAELVRELIASPPITAAETAATYVETRSSRRSGTRDALVSHKLAVARELLLRDLAERMKTEPVLSAPAVVPMQWCGRWRAMGSPGLGRIDGRGRRRR